MKRYTFAFTIVATLLIGAPAVAGGLAPKKPSNLRTGFGSDGGSVACPGLGAAWYSVDQEMNADGTISAFSIPVGSAFVVTSYEFVGCGGPPGALGSTSLAISNGSTFSIPSYGYGEVFGSGCFGGTAQIPTGIAVKGGTTLCFFKSWTTASVTVHGFITSDR